MDLSGADQDYVRRSVGPLDLRGYCGSGWGERGFCAQRECKGCFETVCVLDVEMVGGHRGHILTVWRRGRMAVCWMEWSVGVLERVHYVWLGFDLKDM